MSPSKKIFHSHSASALPLSGLNPQPQPPVFWLRSARFAAERFATESTKVSTCGRSAILFPQGKTETRQSSMKPHRLKHTETRKLHFFEGIILLFWPNGIMFHQPRFP